MKIVGNKRGRGKDFEQSSSVFLTESAAEVIKKSGSEKATGAAFLGRAN